MKRSVETKSELRSDARLFLRIGVLFAVVVTLLALTLTPVFFASAQSGITNFGGVHMSMRSGTATPIARVNQEEPPSNRGVLQEWTDRNTPVARLYSDGGMDFWISGTPIASIGSGGVDTYGHEAIWARYQDVADDAAGNVLTETLAVSATTSITTNITSPDYPRNLRITYQTTTTSTAGTLTVTGTDARGNVRTTNGEGFTIAAISGTQTFTGSIPWAVVSGFTLPTRTEAVSITVGLGEKFGIGKIPASSAEVFYLSIGNVYTSAYTVDTTWGTVLPTADIAANDDLTIGYQK